MHIIFSVFLSFSLVPGRPPSLQSWGQARQSRIHEYSFAACPSRHRLNVDVDFWEAVWYP